MALLTAACSSDEMALNPADQPAPVEQKIPFTAVISADAAGTRALTEASDGKTITAKWEKEEKVALIHGEIIDVLEVSSVDATSGAATISGTITSPANDESVFVVYVGHQHVNMSNYVSRLQEIYTSYKADNPESSAIPTSIISEPVNELLATQDGTLETISNKHDYRFARSTFAVSDGTATFASEVKMPASYAIWKLNLTTDGTTALKAKKLVMKKDGEADVTIDLGNSTSSEFYVAFIVSPSTYSFEATDSDDKTYSCTPTVSSLDAGKFYRSTLTMAAAGNTYRVYTSGTAYTDEAIPATAVTLTSTTTTWAEGTYLVSGEVNISDHVSVTGDVNLILKDGASLTVNNTITGDNLNIYGQEQSTGKLDVVYGDINVSVSNLAIHGGVITVTEGGVQQGLEANESLDIYHGTVTTAGGANGFMVMGDMHVYGGNITASATNGAALQIMGASGRNGSLTMTGGTFKATGAGTGSNNKGILVEEGNGAGTATVTISGGTLIAKGGSAPDNSNTGASAIDVQGTLTINGTANVTANGGADELSTAGGGYGINVRKGSTAGGNMIISAGTLNVTSGYAMAGISIYNITIEGGEVTVTGGSNGEGILANTEGDYPNLTLGEITVNGGTVEATGGENSYGLAGRIINLGSGINLYAGSDPEPSSNPVVGPQNNYDVPESRYVIIKPAE